MNKTYHVYPLNCYNSSRVLTQSSWDKESIFLHKITRNQVLLHGCANNIRLSLFNLLKIIVLEKLSVNIIFHSQSSLLYLHISRLLIFLSKKRNFNVIYDVHDLNELDSSIKYTTYEIVRYQILRILESICFQDKDIKVMTVSSGLSMILKQTYTSHTEPVVVLNIPIDLNTQTSLTSCKTTRYDNAFLFFGQKDRFPSHLVEVINQSGMELHLYGRNFTQEWIEKNFPVDHACIKYLGAYSPDKLDFLFRYKVLLIYSPEYQSMNYVYSLPNKLFQALSYGLSVFVSSNFREMLTMFEDIPGSVVEVEPGSLVSLFKDIELICTETFGNEINHRLEKLYLESANTYQKLTLSTN